MSDHAAFFHDEFVYIAGGYDQNLEAKETVFRINTHLSTESLVIEEMDPLLNFSGELLAIQTSQHVYVASGYTNFGCDGSGIIQRYDFAADGWKTLAPFRGRKHFGMVQLNDIVMLLGGEKLSAEFCSNMIADSKSALTPIDSIEALIPGQWIEVASTKSMHCRFPAVSSQAENSVFTFGGLGAYDENCDCFPVLTEVVEYFHLLSQALSTLESHGQTETDSQTTVPITSFAESQTESSTVPPQTPAPVPPQTPAPVPQPTPAPVLPQTPAPMPQPTPAPVSPQTPAPVPQPTSAPVSPQTPAPIPQPTPAPIPPQTPAPIPQPTLVPIPPQTPAPVTRPTPAPLQIATYPPARTGEVCFVSS